MTAYAQMTDAEKAALNAELTTRNPRHNPMWTEAIVAEREREAEAQAQEKRTTAARVRAVAKLLTPLSAFSSEPPPEPMLSRLDPEGATILFGPGGVGKGTLAVSWISRLLVGGDRVAIIDYEDHPNEWSRRLASLGGALGDVQYIAPNRLWPNSGGLSGHAERIAEALEHGEITYVVIDSAVTATGGADPSAATTPVAYFDGLQVLGLPSLTLAHTTRSGPTQERYPFGSIFWHNLGRMTWSLTRRPGGGTSRILTNRKDNNRDLQAPITVDITFSGGLPTHVTEVASFGGLRDRIVALLADGLERTPVDVAGSLGANRATVRSTLHRGQGTYFKPVDDDHWTCLK